MINFLIQKGYSGREMLAVINYCTYNLGEWSVSDKIDSLPKYTVPVGSVEWVEEYLGQMTPDYYPDFLKDRLYRKVWKSDSYPDEVAFIKPQESYKRFTGYVYDFNPKVDHPDGPFWCSEVVNFKNEWRYYIANGEVLCSWWYQGDVDSLNGPELDIKFPETYCGAVDFGELDTGEIALVEAQHPYSIGWYGDQTPDNYVKFLIEGWKSLCPSNFV